MSRNKGDMEDENGENKNVKTASQKGDVCEED